MIYPGHRNVKHKHARSFRGEEDANKFVDFVSKFNVTDILLRDVGDPICIVSYRCTDKVQKQIYEKYIDMEVDDIFKDPCDDCEPDETSCEDCGLY